MKTTEVISIDGRQAVRLPDEFRFAAAMVSVRKEGDAVILEPLKSNTWPAGFFAAIRIDDPALARPPQGEMPPAPSIGSQLRTLHRHRQMLFAGQRASQS